MSISKKIKAIKNKIESNKAQYNLERQAAKISALSSGNVIKYEFLTSKDVLSKINSLGKTPTLKIFEYLPLGKAFQKQINAVKKQTEVINKKEDKINKLLKIIFGTDKNIVIMWKMLYFICPKHR